MSTAIIFLIIFIVIIFILILLLLTNSAISIVSSNNQADPTNPALPSCTSNVNLSDLIVIPETGFNCIQQGLTGSLYYIGPLGDGTYNYVVAPWQTSPLDVCVGYCDSYNNDICTGPNYQGRTAQQNFDNCISQLTPADCIPPAPIAIRSNILYYAYSPTCLICDGCTNPNII